MIKLEQQDSHVILDSYRIRRTQIINQHLHIQRQAQHCALRTIMIGLDADKTQYVNHRKRGREKLKKKVHSLKFSLRRGFGGGRLLKNKLNSLILSNFTIDN